MKGRVVHLVASIDDEAAGPSVSVPRLAEAQARIGLDVELSTVATGTPPTGARVPAVPLRRHPQAFARSPVLCRLVASEAMRRDLLARAGEIVIAHTHGLWLMPNVYPAAMTASGTRFVLSPRGMLSFDALTFSRRRKRLFQALVQRRALARVALFHATSEAEVDEIRTFGLTAPVAMVPNGVDMPPDDRGERDGPVRMILSLGRIHPKKGLARLVQAFAMVEGAHPNWRLRLVGPSEDGHADELRRLVDALGARNVSIEGPLFGADKLAAYRSASLFALPTLNENFAMTVAEALVAGTPVISTRGAPWAGLEAEGCGLWIDHGPEAMAAALARLMALSDNERTAMGARGRAWMARDFSWEGMARQLALAYTWICEGGNIPASIRLADTLRPDAGRAFSLHPGEPT